MTHNPLLRYYRIPKLYTKLPSGMRWYTGLNVNTSVNQEIAIYPMSALDHITIKTPDALLNGEAMLNVIKNCVPDFPDPKQLVEPDINTIILAIRIATIGNTLEMDATCPNCQHENHYGIDLQPILETQTYIDDPCEINFDNELKVFLRPYNMQQRNLSLLNEVEQAQSVRILENNDTMSDQEKVTEVGFLVTSMASRTFDIAAKSIISVEIVSTGETVTDETQIRDFLKGIQSQQADIILDKIKELNKIGIDSTVNLSCEKCNHQWTQQLDFDPTSFFG